MTSDTSGDRTPSNRGDVCVIGAGPAGALVAHSLAKRGHKVIVLEAGKRFASEEHRQRMEEEIRPAHTGSVWEMGGPRDAFTAAGPRSYPLNSARVKGVGGTTLHWQGMVMRLHEQDFEMNTRYGVGTDWPISYDDLRPYYARAETELGVAGASDNPFTPPRKHPFPLPAFAPSYSDSIFAEACESLGITTHSVPNARNSKPYDGRSQCRGYGTCDPVCPSGAKYSADVHIKKAEKQGARVLDQVPVQRLEHDRSGETIEAAVYATPNGNTYRQKAREFVVACGGVETPRLLLLSQSNAHPTGLANSSGLVGRYFMDHLYAGMGGQFDHRTRQNHIGFLTTESHQFYDSPRQSIGRDHSSSASAASGSSSRSQPDGRPVGSIKLEFSNYAGPSPVEVALGGDQWGDDLLGTLRDAYGNSLDVGGLVEQLPRKENRITLDHSTTDNHGNPVPQIHWSLDARTKRTLRRANTIQRRILDELGVTPTWTVGPKNTGPAFHHMGTTRMGTDPDQSVVTPHLRTHDVRNLWIASSSVFVTGGAMNATLTIAALALKAADHIHKAL